MTLTPIVVDGVTYRVRIVYNTLVRDFALKEGPLAGDVLSGRHERDLLGTTYSYSMQIDSDPRYQSDYDALYEVLSAPVSVHRVTVPYGNSTITYNAMIDGGSDVSQGKVAGVRRWSKLAITFRANDIQRSPE